MRWVHVAEDHSITWSVQPHKKSINFGIFKHPGNKNSLTTPILPTSAIFDPPDTPTTASTPGDGEKARRRGSVAKNDRDSIIEKLQKLGLKCVDWIGNCEADKVSMGTYDIARGQDGTYGLVFDNTFSKTVSKTATFVLMTHPTNAPPKNKALATPYSQTAAAASVTSFDASKSPRLRPQPSSESLNQDLDLHTSIEGAPLPNRTRRNTIGKGLEVTDIHTGILWKKRRKRGQGWAKRFFSLDFTSSTLSYYHDRHSSALRGAVPLSLAAVGADEKTREFSIDSGAEVWHLKASNMKEFEQWKAALEKASKASINTPGPATPAAIYTKTPFASPPPADYVTNREWEKAEQLLGRVSGSRDAIRRLAQDTDSKHRTNSLGFPGSSGGSPASVESSSNPFFVDTDEPASERNSFWKRKPSTGSAPSNNPNGLFKRKVSAQQLTVPGSVPASPAPGALNMPKIRPSTAQSAHTQMPIEDVHQRCLALLKDLDAVVTDFSALLNETKTRRRPAIQPSASRMSIDSIASEEFFDAEDYTEDFSGEPSQLLNIRRSSDQSSQPAEEEMHDVMSTAGDSESSSDAGDTNTAPSITAAAASPAESSLYPVKPRSLSSTIAPNSKYRTTVPPPKQPPPSLINFLRKNAGKDLSSVSMPVSANEPLSALQRLAEPFESVNLLHTAASLTQSDNAAERLLYVAAFAVTNFAANRVKERAQRKPFNPMLGETFELVRSDLGFRFVSEKVVHRPVRMAFQADALNGTWSISQSAQPTSKFWGKSAEVNTEGQLRLVLHSVGESGERYSWTLAPAFLRNVIAGEKYIEPTSSMTVLNEATGMKAVATFKAGSLFSGRSEDVNVALYEPGSTTPDPLSLAGKWTTSLSRPDTSAVIWEAGPIVPDANKNWGFTSFAAMLNELSSDDKKLLPPTDSRLRPDQRALEDGNLDEAEALKARLEERQRGRRKVLESHGAEWQPRFFERVDIEGESSAEEEVWALKSGREGYWECREKNSWQGVSRVFEV